MPLSTPEYSTSRPITRWLQRIWWNSLVTSDPKVRRRLAAVTLALIFFIGALDFLLGFEVSLLVFYCLPVVLGTAALSWRFGVAMSFLSVATWIAGDLAAGAHYHSWVVPWWNTLIALSTYLIIVWLFSTVRTLQRDMEQRIQQRTAALTNEIIERERLEKVILEIGERERSSIGRDLHDDLGQHLTGTALALQVLGEKLQAREAGEAKDVRRIVDLVEEGIEKTRRLAKGLLLAEIERNGLRSALLEYAATAGEQFRINCSFECDEAVDCMESSVATHLFRITQESVRNAVRHGKAKWVEISLKSSDGRLVLTIEDDGSGLPPSDQRGQGLGLQIMEHRAGMIRASFKVEAVADGGTRVECRFPADPIISRV